MNITITCNTPTEEYEWEFEGTPDTALQEAVKLHPNATSLVLVFCIGENE